MKCWLRNLDPSYPSFELKDKVFLLLGRGPHTKIKDNKVSKEQIEVTPNFGLKTVSIKQIGPNNTSINGNIIRIGLTVQAVHDDVIQLSVRAKEPCKYRVDYEISEEDLLNESTNCPKPPKIPRLAQQRTITEMFRKDELLAKGVWETIDNSLLVYAGGTDLKKSKLFVGSFDLDGTIITTASGRVFPKDANDWKFLYENTISKIQTFFVENFDYKFLIFTNQNGIKSEKDIPPFKTKIEKIVKILGVPALVFVAPKKDKFRKPVTGAWKTFVERYNEGVEPDRTKSFYVGDAAGRVKDHSKGDRLFALNLGLNFKLPEEFFNRKTYQGQEFKLPLFISRNYIEEASRKTNGHINYPNKQEMIIMVGIPASGKSTFVAKELVPKGYVPVNRDTLKTIPKCAQVTESALKDGKSVVIDNTNPAKNDREGFIKLAKKYNIPSRCFQMDCDHPMALHNNKFRSLIGDSDLIPDVAFNGFKARFQPPTMDEGFKEIVPVYFIPEFATEERKEFYCQYLLEK